MPERTLLKILARTAYWLEWRRRFGPHPVGPEARRARCALRADDVRLRREWARRRPPGISPACPPTSSVTPRHFTTEKLNRRAPTSSTPYRARPGQGVGRRLGRGGRDQGRHADRQPARRVHIRYGGYGGIAYHHVADNYIALFSHFIPCGVWEAVTSSKGCSAAIQGRAGHDPRRYARAELPCARARAPVRVRAADRIRNWKDLTFYRAAPSQLRAHRRAVRRARGERDQLGADRDALGDLMQVVLSIRAGRLSSSCCCAGSRPSRGATTSTRRSGSSAGRSHDHLLRYLPSPSARQIDAATNKVESYNKFSDWLRVRGRPSSATTPPSKRSIIKFNTLLANCEILHIALDMTASAPARRRRLGDYSLAAVVSSRRTSEKRIKRFGEYATDGLIDPPDAFDPHLPGIYLALEPAP